MSGEEARGILVVGHGSRRAEANEDVRGVARLISERGHFPLVEAAFLEIEQPDISAGFARLVARGARSIIVHPYFLSPGRHTRGDIPVEVRLAAEQHPGLSYLITEPLAAHHLVIEASIERIRQTSGWEASAAMDTSTDTLCGARKGWVYLVGAGPGDPGLLTIKARDLLASCDICIYDNLVNPELLRHVPINAERLYVGKIGGGRHTPQETINRLLIEHAREGRGVVRLKGGDPFLFGRGGEEAEALRAVGIPYEVVPGVSSALAVPAYAGIPLTHRGVSSSVAIVTGARTADGESVAQNLAALSSADTIIILMGVTHLREITAELMTHGRSPATPAAVIRWGTYGGQQVITGTLHTIPDEAARAGLRAPAVIVVGEVVRLRERLKWFETCFASFLSEETDRVIATAQ